MSPTTIRGNFAELERLSVNGDVYLVLWFKSSDDQVESTALKTESGELLNIGGKNGGRAVGNRGAWAPVLLQIIVVHAGGVGNEPDAEPASLSAHRRYIDASFPLLSRCHSVPSVLSAVRRSEVPAKK